MKGFWKPAVVDNAGNVLMAGRYASRKEAMRIASNWDRVASPAWKAIKKACVLETRGTTETKILYVNEEGS